MSLSKIDELKVHIVISCFIALLITAPQAMAQPCAVDPASGGANILPNVLLIFDNSYSMCLYANVDLNPDKTAIVDYNKDKTYSGIFNPGARYNYIGDATNLTNTGYFEENASGNWSGNFLNWVTALRIDVSRKVLTGGKLTTSGNTYITTNTWVNFVSGYDPDYTGDPNYYTYVNVSIVPRPYPYTNSPVTANQVPSTFGTVGFYTPTWYYTNIGHSGSNDWSRLLVKTTILSNFPTNHDPVSGDYVYNIRIKTDSSNLQGLLDDLQGQIRIGLMHFNSSNNGGNIVNYVKKLDSSQLTAIKNNLNRDLGDGWTGAQTCLAETLYEAARFFGQLSPAWSGDYTVSQANDPLYYAEWGKRLGCGRNYVIIMTDGEATQDRDVPVSITVSGTTIPVRNAYSGTDPPIDKSDSGVDCDASPCPCDKPGCGYYGLCDCSQYPFCTVGVDPGCSYGNGSAYLDDVAYFAKRYALRTINGIGPTLTTHTVYTYGTGGGVADILLQKTAARGGGQYFTANNAEDLTDHLQQILNVIMNKAAAAASTAITSEPIAGVDLIYIPYYKHPYADQWWGNIRAFRMGSDGSLLLGTSGSDVAYDTDNDLVLDDPKWDAAINLQTMDRTTRTIFTYIPTSKRTFDSTVGSYFDVDLNNNGTKDESAEVSALVKYIKGNDTPSEFPTSLRGRMNNYLGDIMHANPVFVGEPSARYDLIYSDSSYWDFFWDNDDRTKVLYAPANDGMLHCFDASSGEEKWAYIPYNLLPHLKWLTSPDYGTCHIFYNDLTANVWDMKLGSDWKSILVGGMRLGGTPIGVDHDNNAGTANITLRSAIFALDVTDPNNPQVLWEKNDNGASDKFGYTTSKPIPVKVGSNWYLVFGSGPKSRNGEGAPASPGDYFTDNNGYIFVVNPSDGSMSTISLGSLGASNFFSSPVAIDYDLDYSVDLIYIGDAKGNLWRIKTFTESGATKTYQPPGSWAIDVSGATGISNPQPLLSLGTDQPIVIKPAVTMDEKGRIWIYFGTGRYYCAYDNDCCGSGIVCPPTLVSGVCPSGNECYVSELIDGTYVPRSRYIAVGVYDRHWATDKFVLQSITLGTGNLDHRVIKAGDIVGPLEEGIHETGYYIVDYDTGEIASDVSATKKGWYFHLLADKERSLGDYLVYQGAVFFISFKPDSSDPCSNNGGLSLLYGVNYTSGTSATQSLFDLTGDRNINGSDLVRDVASNDHGAALLPLITGFAGGGLRIKQFELAGGGTATMGYTPLAQEGLILNPPGETYNTGVTSWREVWQ
jgi:type IV pilus assembly protein PilY1